MAKASQVVLSENEFYLIKAPNGKVLEVKNFNTENGAAIRLWDYAGHPWQQWKFVDAGEGRWRIQNRFTGKMIDLALGGVVEGTWLHQWSRTSGLSQCWELESTRNGRTRIRNVLADKYIDLVGMNTSNGAQAQIWNYVSGGNQEWNLVRVDPDTAQTNARAEEKRDPEPTPSQRKHQNDLVRKLNNAGKGRAARLPSRRTFALTPKKRRLSTLPLLRSTIDVVGLNFSVRNGKRWIPNAITTLIPLCKILTGQPHYLK